MNLQVSKKIWTPTFSKNNFLKGLMLHVFKISTTCDTHISDHSDKASIV